MKTLINTGDLCRLSKHGISARCDSFTVTDDPSHMRKLPCVIFDISCSCRAVCWSSCPDSRPIPQQEFRLATEGYRYAFPRDHGAHEEFRTEWWYYTGQVTAKDGRPFGYELTFFRRGMPRDQTKTLPSQWAVTQLYLAHFAISDLSKGRFSLCGQNEPGRFGQGRCGAVIGSTSGSIGGAPNRHRPLLALRPSRQQMATLPSNSRSRRKNHSSCMAPTVSAAKARPQDKPPTTIPSPDWPQPAPSRSEMNRST